MLLSHINVSLLLFLPRFPSLIIKIFLKKKRYKGKKMEENINSHLWVVSLLLNHFLFCIFQTLNNLYYVLLLQSETIFQRFKVIPLSRSCTDTSSCLKTFSVFLHPFHHLRASLGDFHIPFCNYLCTVLSQPHLQLICPDGQKPYLTHLYMP